MLQLHVRREARHRSYGQGSCIFYIKVNVVNVLLVPLLLLLLRPPPLRPTRIPPWRRPRRGRTRRPGSSQSRSRPRRRWSAYVYEAKINNIKTGQESYSFPCEKFYIFNGKNNFSFPAISPFLKFSVIPVYPYPPVEVRRHLPDGHPVRLPTIKVVGAVAGAEHHNVEAVPSRTGLFGTKKIICRL